MSKPDYAVYIHSQGYSQLQVTWTFGNLNCRTYLIDRGLINKVSEQIRSKLSSLVAIYLKREKAGYFSEASESREGEGHDESDLHEILISLAQLGKNLYDLLFTSESGSCADQAYVDRIKKNIAQNESAVSICFFVAPRVCVPWGLMHFDDVDPVQNNVASAPEFGSFEGFWGVRHYVSCVLGGALSPIDFVAAYEPETFKIVLAGDETEYHDAYASIKEFEVEREYYVTLKEHSGEPATNSASLFDTWCRHKDNIGLLYLFCHASETDIQFSSPEDLMDTVGFRKLRRAGSSTRCLVFLNGCCTAAPDSEGTFLEATALEGFCGFIGAETEAPVTFAFRYGLEFQYMLLNGIEVVDIMRRLLIKHWPLSLIYSLYGFPHIRVGNANYDMEVKLTNLNYSTGPLGRKISESERA